MIDGSFPAPFVTYLPFGSVMADVSPRRVVEPIFFRRVDNLKALSSLKATVRHRPSTKIPMHPSLLTLARCGVWRGSQ